ncbi:MAG: hypothetical protein RM049_23395 [Nostoc sp. DedQUE04]|uniref:hypothetical protein n=1 Tax=Nostoc sp. DedQUE04 TaxID=3075390 RepID=UPI002AD4B5AD|nr:hypothetical protein [Nostoc sp. DedQUE04]MDZ8138215.1 hypothetical protein [Nostoc sp. DedQUE04]
MKAITVKAPLSWAIFNANFTVIRRYESIGFLKQVAIHASKQCTRSDCENFFRMTGIKTPPHNRLPLGQVVGLVDVIDSQQVDANRWDWKIANPRSINRFHHKGQLGIYEIPDDWIDHDCSKNCILEECGYKSSCNSRGQWRITVWPHPNTANHYSFAVGIGGGVMSGGIPGHDTLHGCYSDPEKALQVGIKELYQP